MIDIIKQIIKYQYIYKKTGLLDNTIYNNIMKKVELILAKKN